MFSSMRHYCTTATSHAPSFHVKVCFCFLSCLFNHPMLDSNNSKNEKSRMSNIQPGIDVICLVFLPTQTKDFSIVSSNIDNRYLLKYYVDVDIWILSTDIYSQCGQLPRYMFPRHPPRYFSQSFVASQGSGEGYNSLNMTGRGTLTGAYCDYILWWARKALDYKLSWSRKINLIK